MGNLYLNYMSSLETNQSIKFSGIYSEKILPELKWMRGATKLALITNSIGINQITSKHQGQYNVKITENETRKFKNLETVQKYSRFEYSQTKFILENLDQKSIFYDIGGYHGYHTIIGSIAEKVHVFEPDPENLEKLKQNIELNPEQNIKTVERPVWSSQEEIKLETGLEGTSKVNKEKGNTSKKGVKIDNYAQETGEIPDLIKIDVEGAEYQVLQGGKETLEKHRPKLIIEVHKGERINRLGGSLQKIEELLKDLNYSITKKDRGSETHIYATKQSNKK